MNRKNNLKVFVGIFIILLFVLLGLLTTLLKTVEKRESTKVEAYAEEVVTPKTVIEKYENVYLSTEGNTFYVEFKKDLFEPNGSNNKNFFESIVSELIPFFEDKTFSLVDNQKNIKVYVEYDYKDKEHHIIYNDVEDFYGTVDGKSYIAADTVTISNRITIYVEDYYLERLKMKDFYFSAISEKLKDGVEKENKYVDYLDGTLSIRLAPNNVVKNIIYKNGFKDRAITSRVTINTPLSEVYETYGEPAFGSLEKRYLGYISDNIYYFFYDNEISIYPYAYKNNKDFEKLLSKFLEDNDLNNFIYELTDLWKNYDVFKYNEETQEVYLLYGSRGVEISYKGDPNDGITLYNNYFFTNKTKSFVKKGFLRINSEEDLINIIESKRRDGTLVIE